MTGDFHVHTEFSIDSQATAAIRMKEFAAEGLEMPVVTDHDTRSDFLAVAQLMDAQAWVHPVIGSEVSPVIGHANVWPLTGWRDDLHDYYGIPLVKYDDNGTVERLQFGNCGPSRDVFGAEIAQVNHPRDGTGWFDWLGYDPAIGIAERRAQPVDPNFEAIEVFNSGANDQGTLADWFSFLDQGYIYTMTGNSDTHGIGNPGRSAQRFRHAHRRSGDGGPGGHGRFHQGAPLLRLRRSFCHRRRGQLGHGRHLYGSRRRQHAAGRHRPSPWIRINYLKGVDQQRRITSGTLAIPETTDVVRFDDAST